MSTLKQSKVETAIEILYLRRQQTCAVDRLIWNPEYGRCMLWKWSALRHKLGVFSRKAGELLRSISVCDLAPLFSLCHYLFNELFAFSRLVLILLHVKTHHEKSRQGFNCFGKRASLSPAQIWDQSGSIAHSRYCFVSGREWWVTMLVFMSPYWKRILNGRMTVDIEHPCILNGEVLFLLFQGQNMMPAAFLLTLKACYAAGYGQWNFHASHLFSVFPKIPQGETDHIFCIPFTE